MGGISYFRVREPASLLCLFASGKNTNTSTHIAMNKTALIYGGIIVAIITLITIVPLLALGLNEQTVGYEAIGYISMVLACLAVFFGVLSYRNKHQSGSITFGKALVTGLYISLIGAFGFGVVSWLYYGFLEPDFLQAYYDSMVQGLQQSGKEPEVIQAEVAAMEADKWIFLNPAVGGLTMFGTVFPIGAIISVVSALVLKRSKSATQ